MAWTTDAMYCPWCGVKMGTLSDDEMECPRCASRCWRYVDDDNQLSVSYLFTRRRNLVDIQEVTE